jgi:hypothetical protein
MMTAGRRVAAGATTLVLVGLAAALFYSFREPSSRDIARSLHVESIDRPATWNFDGDDSSVAILSLPAVDAIEDVDIVSASPISDSGVQVHLLDTRLAFLRVFSEHVEVNGTAGYFCVPHWPLAGYGPTYHVPIRLRAAEHANVIAYWQVGRPGESGQLDGLRLSFRRVRDGRMGTVDIRGVAGTITNLGSKHSTECSDPEPPSFWTTPYKVAAR